MTRKVRGECPLRQCFSGAGGGVRSTSRIVPSHRFLSAHSSHAYERLYLPTECEHCHEADRDSDGVDGLGRRLDRISGNGIRRRTAEPRTVAHTDTRTGAVVPIPKLRGECVMQPRRRECRVRDQQSGLHTTHRTSAMRSALRVGRPRLAGPRRHGPNRLPQRHIACTRRTGACQRADIVVGKLELHRRRRIDALH